MKILMIGTTVQSLLGFRYELIKDLVNAGHTVYALSVDYDDSSKRALIDIGAVPVGYTISRSGINPFKDFVNFISLYKILKKYLQTLFFLILLSLVFGGRLLHIMLVFVKLSLCLKD